MTLINMNPGNIEKILTLKRKHAVELAELFGKEAENRQRLGFLHALKFEDLFGNRQSYTKVAESLRGDSNELKNLRIKNKENRLRLREKQRLELEMLKSTFNESCE